MTVIWIDLEPQDDVVQAFVDCLIFLAIKNNDVKTMVSFFWGVEVKDISMTKHDLHLEKIRPHFFPFISGWDPTPHNFFPKEKQNPTEIQCP